MAAADTAQRHRLSTALVLGAVTLTSMLIYGPALRSAFMYDDYEFLVASRDLSWRQFLDAIMSRDYADFVAFRDRWRPLSMITFKLGYEIFGASPVAFHTLLLASHIASVVLIWFVTMHVANRRLAAGVAAVVFAAHPAAFESVTWAAAISSMALPFALGAWLLFMKAEAADLSQRARTWRHAFALVLFAIALLYRETSAVILLGLIAWQLVRRRGRLRAWATYRPLVPYFVVVIAIIVISNPFGLGPKSGHADLSPWGIVSQVWFYLRQAALPFNGEPPSGMAPLQHLAAALLLLSPVVAFVLRRWMLFGVLVAFIVSLVPLAGATRGEAARYAYFSIALFAIAVGVAAAEVLAALEPRWSARALVTTLVMITAVVIAVFVVSGRSRVDQWQRKGPALYERVNDGLDAEVGPLPDDGILYVTNVPIELALYDGYPMRFLLRYRSPDTNTEVVWFDGQQIDSIRAQLRPQDRIFLFRNRDG